MCNGSINKGIKRVYGCVMVVRLRYTLVRRIWTTWIFLYSSEIIIDDIRAKILSCRLDKKIRNSLLQKSL